MSGVVEVWRSRLRRSWGGTLVLVLLLALGIGAGLACIAGARRTESAFDRILEATRTATLGLSHGAPPAEAVTIANGFTGVVDHSTQVGFVGFVEGLDPTYIKYYIGAWGPQLSNLPVLRAGRLAVQTRADEVVISGHGATRGGIEPGDTITAHLFSSDFSETVSNRFVVTGIVTDPSEIAADAASDATAVRFTDAFTREHASRLQHWSATQLVAASGIDVDTDLVPQILAVGWPIDATVDSARARVQDAIGPLTTTVFIVGILILVATVVVAGHALSRQVDARRNDRRPIRAMGMTTRQIRAVDLLAALTMVVPGALLGIVVALALSPLFPIGSVRALEPDRGVDLDLTALGVGAAAVIATLLVGHSLVARRSEVAVRTSSMPRMAFTGSPAVDTGLRLAIGGTNVQRRAFWGTLASSGAALALVVSGLAFVAALDRLSEDPRRYGVDWDLTARNAYGEIAPEDVRAMIEGDDDIVGVTGATTRKMLLDGSLSVPGMAFLPFTAALWPTVTAGTAPHNDNEILVGADVLEQLDASLGDTITLHAQDSSSGPSPEVTIVGTAVFPPIEIPGIDAARLGFGVAMTWDRFQSLAIDAEGLAVLPDLTLFDLADGVDPAAVIARYPEGMPDRTGIAPTEWLTTLAPAEVVETQKATRLIWTVIGLLAAVVLAVTGLTLISTLRRRRGTYAVLKAIGFTPRQVLGAVTAQWAITTTLALIVGIPTGIIFGRWSWQLFARRIGVIDAPVLPLLAVGVVIAGSLVGVIALGSGPAIRASRRQPASALRSE